MKGPVLITAHKERLTKVLLYVASLTTRDFSFKSNYELLVGILSLLYHAVLQVFNITLYAFNKVR